MNNPFHSHFESFEGPLSPTVETLHEAELTQLKGLVNDEQGTLISLRAPRAGYGKTMLLSRLREDVREESVIAEVGLGPDFQIDEEGLLARLFEQLMAEIPGHEGVTKLDLLTRRLLAKGLIPMVESGEVPSSNRTESLRGLKEQPEEIFDFHQETAVVAQWVKAQFGILSPRLINMVGELCGEGKRDFSFWFEELCRYAMTPPDQDQRGEKLIEEIFGEDCRFRARLGYKDGLSDFLKLLTLTENVVLVVDEVDGLFGNKEGALRFSHSLIMIRQFAPRLKLIFSANDDVWQSTFAQAIPLGMQDRLEEVVIRLKSLDERSARELLKVREEKHFGEIMSRLKLGHADFYPRAILRAAREIWPQIATRYETDSEKNFGETAKAPFVQQQEEGSAGSPSEIDSEVTSFVTEEVVVKPLERWTYPPKPVRRVTIPRRYVVQRIRKEVESVCVPPPPPIAAPVTPPAGPPFESPFQIADSGRGNTTPPPLPSEDRANVADEDSIDDLLRKFQERKDTDDPR